MEKKTDMRNVPNKELELLRQRNQAEIERLGAEFELAGRELEQRRLEGRVVPTLEELQEQGAKIDEMIVAVRLGRPASLGKAPAGKAPSLADRIRKAVSNG
jgi:hypothetical protein